MMYGWGKRKITCKAAQFRASGRDLGKFFGKKIKSLLTTVEKRHTPFSGNFIVKNTFCEKFSHKILFFRKLFVIFYIGETKCY